MNAEHASHSGGKPPWIRVSIGQNDTFNATKNRLRTYGLHTVCEEAFCPNLGRCWKHGRATIMLLGDRCTRGCRFCNVDKQRVLPPDPDEPANVAAAVKETGLKEVVLTSVTRDDLPDGGAYFFAECIDRLRRENPEIKTEVLIPDFRGNAAALDKTIKAAPNVINHNMEVVRSLFGRLRPQGNYTLSLNILRHVSRRAVIAKSGFMVGLGETNDDILSLMDDLASTGCARLTIGQYQQPTRKHWPVARYYHPEEFAKLKEIAYQKGFQHVESGPLVRSSYHAAREV